MVINRTDGGAFVLAFWRQAVLRTIPALLESMGQKNRLKNLPSRPPSFAFARFACSAYTLSETRICSISQSRRKYIKSSDRVPASTARFFSSATRSMKRWCSHYCRTKSRWSAVTRMNASSAEKCAMVYFSSSSTKAKMFFLFIARHDGAPDVVDQHQQRTMLLIYLIGPRQYSDSTSPTLPPSHALLPGKQKDTRLFRTSSGNNRPYALPAALITFLHSVAIEPPIPKGFTR